MSSKKVTKQKTAWDQQLNDLENDAHPPKEQKTYENIPIVVIGDEKIPLWCNLKPTTPIQYPLAQI